MKIVAKNRPFFRHDFISLLSFYLNWGLYDLQRWRLTNLLSLIKPVRLALTLGSHLRVPPKVCMIIHVWCMIVYFSKICCKFTGEPPCRSAITMKLLYNFIAIALRYGCAPVNLLHMFWNLSLRTLLDGCFCKDQLYFVLDFSVISEWVKTYQLKLKPA